MHVVAEEEMLQDLFPWSAALPCADGAAWIRLACVERERVRVKERESESDRTKESARIYRFWIGKVLFPISLCLPFRSTMECNNAGVGNKYRLSEHEKAGSKIEKYRKEDRRDERGGAKGERRMKRIEGRLRERKRKK